MHRTLMAHTPEEAGQWRSQQVWIGGTSYGPHLAEFIPPHHTRVKQGMSDVIAFANRTDVATIPHLALAHAQFETIHPFADGNGRTGRALVHTLLRSRGLTQHVTVPISAGLLTDVDAYFAALTEYRQGRPEPIVTQFIRASHTAIVNSRRLVADLRDTHARWQESIRARKDSAVWRLADLLLRQPVVDSATVHDALGVTSANAHRAIRELEQANVVTEFSGKQRRRLWQASEVISALDDFAVRAGRRRP
jgi:Fic family protein